MPLIYYGASEFVVSHRHHHHHHHLYLQCLFEVVVVVQEEVRRKEGRKEGVEGMKVMVMALEWYGIDVSCSPVPPFYSHSLPPPPLLFPLPSFCYYSSSSSSSSSSSLYPLVRKFFASPEYTEGHEMVTCCSVSWML
ncbi:hypothetical protein E2C01_084299 [Portunus trituberculatus]|uniref:Uncharacterized protein n=1 Tax=Portunus trituberculatus TaxID=210409 RepID=A0A5B7J734_PORTR|nr:hypothetical protein [Portunus trituberculatus]